MTESEYAPSEVGTRIRSGVLWKAVSQITLQASRLVVALTVARLLAPQEWGLAAMVIVFSSVVVVFTDNALGTALIQRRVLYPGDRSTVFWVSVGLGLLLALCGVAGSGALARFYGEQDVRPLFVAVSIGFFISALGTTHSALLVREMHFRRLELRQIASTLAGAVLAIWVAMAGYGAWAIVAQQLAEAATSTVLLWCLMPWRPSFRVSTASLRRLGGFAGNVFGENLLIQTCRMGTSLLIGRVLGAAALGTYTLATNVVLVPFTRIAGPLQQVFFPAFSRMSDDRERLADVWIRATRLVGLLAIPSLIGLIVVAPDFVHVVLGPRWSETATTIQLLAGVGVVISLQTLTGEVLLALGRAGTLFRFTFFSVVVYSVAVILGLRWGIDGVALLSLIGVLLVEPLRLALATRALGIPLWRFFAALSGIAQAAAAMAVILLVTRMALLETGVPAWGRLAALVLLGAVVFVLCVLWRAPEISLEIRAAVGRRGRGRPRMEAAEARL